MGLGNVRADAPAGGALEGIRVLDLSRIVAGPYAGQILGDLGADVIKIERPGPGDEARWFGVNTLAGKDGGRSSDNAFHLGANRNKRSLTLDISRREGQEVLLKLIEQADVLIENFKAGTMNRFGLDYEAVRKLNPRLIYCSITGYGQDGPYASRAGLDGVFQAQSGLMNVTGPAEDEPNSQPYKTGPTVVDVTSGMYAVIGILAALHHRNATGQGQYLDLSLFDCAIALTSHSAMEYLISGKTLPRVGNQANGGAPASSFRCKDCWIYLSPGSEVQVRKMLRILGLEHLLELPEFATSQLRFINRAKLNPLIEDACANWSAEELSETLNNAGVPAGVVNNYERTFADPQVLHRGVQIKMPHPVAGEVSMIANPLRLSKTPPSYRCLPPGLGEHNDEVLHDIAGFRMGEIAELREKGII